MPLDLMDKHLRAASFLFAVGLSYNRLYHIALLNLVEQLEYIYWEK